MATTTELRLIPIPSDKLTRKIALEWLRDEAPGYLSAAVQACNPDCEMRADQRNDFAMLLIDTREMVGACSAVLAGKRRRLVEQIVESPYERSDVLAQLARIVAARAQAGNENAGGIYEAAFDALADRLADLLAEREAA